MAERHYWIILRQDAYYSHVEYVEGKKCVLWSKRIDQAHEFTSIREVEKTFEFLKTRNLKLKNSIEIFKVVHYYADDGSLRQVKVNGGLFVGQKFDSTKPIKGVKKK